MRVNGDTTGFVKKLSFVIQREIGPVAFLFSNHGRMLSHFTVALAARIFSALSSPDGQAQPQQTEFLLKLIMSANNRAHSASPGESFTDTEVKIASLLLEGHDRIDLARLSGRSENTIRQHLGKMYNKRESSQAANSKAGDASLWASG